MATATVLQFMQKTAEDDALRQQLETLLGVGDGNISSETELDLSESEALKGDRAPAVAAFACENGYNFSVDELVNVVDAFQKHQAGQLSDNDFAAMLGVTIAANDSTSMPGIAKVKHWFIKTYLGHQA